MLSLEKATRPPPTSTTRSRMTIGRRVSAKATKAFSIRPGPTERRPPRFESNSPRCGRKGVAEEESVLGGDSLARLQPVQNLVQPVLLQADFDGAPDEAPGLAVHPDGHGAVALPHHAREGNRRGTHDPAGAYLERSEHSGPQLVLWVAHFRADEDPARTGVHRSADVDDLPAEQPARISLHVYGHLLAKL